jgi:hypothetical protein
MDRPYSTTRSITQVEVSAAHDAITLRYWPRTVLESGRCGEALVRLMPMAASTAAAHGG